MKAIITVTLKPGVLDTQGRAVRHTLEAMDGQSIKNVRIGKYIEVEIDEENETVATAKLKRMCEKLLANPVTENYKVEIENG